MALHIQVIVDFALILDFHSLWKCGVEIMIVFR